MGGCQSSWGCRKAHKVKVQQCLSPNLRFARKQIARIKEVNIAGQILGFANVEYNLNDPVLSFSRQISIGWLNVWASAWVIPGCDPRQQYPKECQDAANILNNDDNSLIMQYDGHGKNGAVVVAACQKISRQFYETKLKGYGNDCGQFLIDSAHEQENYVTKMTWDVTGSGTTAVFILLKENEIVCGNIGDSRGIIATTKPDKFTTAPKEKLWDFGLSLSHVKQSRQWSASNNITAIQLTKDQKPEDPKEKERIVDSGGMVDKIKDNLGNPIGPYRSFKSGWQFPGLAMARSIGDTAGTEIGIISTPEITRYAIGSSEQFIVTATDGVWDVMDNHEVVSFVESYRGLCKRNVERPMPGSVDVIAENTTIAQFLCEEARYRWNSVVEDEDVMIDDISCTVIEFNTPDKAMDQMLTTVDEAISRTGVTPRGENSAVDTSIKEYIRRNSTNLQSPTPPNEESKDVLSELQEFMDNESINKT